MRAAVILAGGWGQRLWPLSTRERPKQLLVLGGDDTLVARTVKRVAPLVSLDESLVLTGRTLRDTILPELKPIPSERVIGEPVGRNTAPAIALAARILSLRDPDAVMVVLPADHLIGGDREFAETLELAMDAAEREAALVTLGVRPTRPETEYGYIKIAEKVRDGVHRVGGFVEKPDAATAARYLAEGSYLWNSGMFVWRADRILDEVRKHIPALASLVDAFDDVPGTDGFDESLARFYEAAPSVSIDYGVMEKAERVLVVPASFEWDDVGAWTAMARVWEPDGEGNACRGDAVVLDSSGCVIDAEEGTVAVLGMEDVIVVRTAEATLVCPRSRAADVRKIVAALAERD